MAGGVYHSGDLAYRDEAGYVYFAGRLGDWMRVDGENLGTAPIERILLRHPDVVEVAVYAIPDPAVGDQVMAALVLSDVRRIRRGAVRGVPRRATRPGPQAVADVRPRQHRAAPHRDVQGAQAPAVGRGHRLHRPGAIRSGGSVGVVGYRELQPPAPLRELVETAWVVDGPGDAVRVLPDGCMDLIRMHGRVVVAGPDTTASVSARGPEPFAGLRFRPGVLPRLLGVPAAELRDQRIALDDLGTVAGGRPLAELAHELAAREPPAETAPWSLTTLRHVTSRLAAGALGRTGGARRRLVEPHACSGRARPSTATAPRRCAACCASATRCRSCGPDGRRPTSPSRPDTPTSRTYTARCARWPAPPSPCWPAVNPAGRTDPPTCRRDPRPSRNAAPRARRTGASVPGWPEAVSRSNSASTSVRGSHSERDGHPAGTIRRSPPRMHACDDLLGVERQLVPSG